MEKGKTAVGVIGSGAISGIYLTNMTKRFANLEVKGIASADADGPAPAGKSGGIRHHCL